MDETMRLRVLWAALLSSVGIITVLMSVLPPAAAEPQSIHLIALAAVALGNAVLSFIVPRQVYLATLAKSGLATSKGPDPEAPSGFGQVSRVRLFQDSGQARRVGLAAYRTKLILALALSEAVALFGFALNRLGHPPAVALPFGLLALALVAVRMPSERAALAELQRTTGARLP